MPGLEGDFTDNPQLQELIEYLRGTILPTDVQTGEVTTDQSGVEAPNIGSDLSPYNAGYFKRLVIGGVVVVITDLANFSPFIITREASAPATGQHLQTFNWPFETLTGAIVHLVGPQSGGEGGDGGFYCRPDFLSQQNFLTRPTGGFSRARGYGGSSISSNPDVVRATISAGANGHAVTASFALDGLSLGAEITLGFGKGGAGGAGGLGAVYPQSLETFTSDGVLFSSYEGNVERTDGVDGTDGVGVTLLKFGGRFAFANYNPSLGSDRLAKSLFTDLTLAGDDSDFAVDERSRNYLSLPGGTGFETPRGALGLDTIFGDQNAGRGGVAGIPAEGNTGTPARAGAGGDGNAGHDGFALIYPRL